MERCIVLFIYLFIFLTNFAEGQQYVKGRLYGAPGLLFTASFWHTVGKNICQHITTCMNTQQPHTRNKTHISFAVVYPPYFLPFWPLCVCVCVCVCVVTDLALQTSWPSWSQKATRDRSGNCTSTWKSQCGRFYCALTQSEVAAQGLPWKHASKGATTSGELESSGAVI